MTNAVERVKQQIFSIIEELPESEYTNLQEYLLFLKHKSYLSELEEDRREELALMNHSLQQMYKEDDSEDSVYDEL